MRDVGEWDGIEAWSMACPAMPLCGLAIGEAERGLPAVNERIRALLDKLGFDRSEQFVVRMTGEAACWLWASDGAVVECCFGEGWGLARCPYGSDPWALAAGQDRTASAASPGAAFSKQCPDLPPQGAPTAARGPTWLSWALWRTAPTPTRCVGWGEAEGLGENVGPLCRKSEEGCS